MRIVTLLFLCGVLIAVTGCVSKGKHQREIADLESQVEGLANQTTQLGSTLQAEQEKSRGLESELATLRAQKPAEAAPVSGFGIYRTPSGFELPAADIQKALKSAGYYAGTVDGKIGPDSREAVRNFQRDNGLTADGVCGRETWSKLKPYLDVLK